MCSALVLNGQVQLLVSNDPGLVVPMNLVLLVIVIDGCPSSMYFRHKEGNSLGHLQQKFDGTSELKQKNCFSNCYTSTTTLIFSYCLGCGHV